MLLRNCGLESRAEFSPQAGQPLQAAERGGWKGLVLVRGSALRTSITWDQVSSQINFAIAKKRRLLQERNTTLASSFSLYVRRCLLGWFLTILTTVYGKFFACTFLV